MKKLCTSTLFLLLIFTTSMNSFAGDRSHSSLSCTKRAFLLFATIAGIANAHSYTATLYKDPSQLPEESEDVVDYHCRIVKDAQGKKSYDCIAVGNQKIENEEFPARVVVPKR